METIDVLRSGSTDVLACELREQMALGVVAFAYKKKSTGELRIAHGTLRPDLIDYVYKGSDRQPPEGQITYWDTDKHAWRCLKEENIIQIP